MNPYHIGSPNFRSWDTPICPLHPEAILHNYNYKTPFPRYPYTYPGQSCCCQSPVFNTNLHPSLFQHKNTPADDEFVSLILEKKSEPLRLPTLQQAPGERMPIIIQFNIPALLEKFPHLSKKERSNHSYLNQLRQKYNDWLNQIREKTPAVHLRHVYHLLVSGIAITLWKEDVAKLKNLPFIKAIYPDEKTTEDTKTHGSPVYRTPRAYLNQTNLNQHNLDIIGVPHAHAMLDKADQPLDGRGIRIAVLEHGFDLQHLRFGPEGKVMDQYSFEKNNEDVFTPNDSEHGTTVTQIILDVAPNAHISAYKTLSNSEVIAGLERAVARHAQIINISLKPQGEFNPIIEAASTAVKNGVILVNSTGNNAAKDEVSAPGTAPFVLSVGATNKSGDQVAGFSNYDASLPKPDVVAPGYYQLDSKIVKNGTSYAAPYVSGSIALLLQKHPNWNPSDVMSALTTTATPIREKNSSAFFSQGWGRMNAFNAIQTDTFISPLHMSVQVFPNQTIQATLDIENRSNFDKEYHLYLENKDIPSSISITFPSSQITVPSHTTGKMPFSINASPYTPSTEKYFGRIQLISDTNEWYIPILLDIHPITFHVPDLSSVALSPNGKLIAAASGNKEIQLWDITTGHPNPVLSFEIGEDINSLSFSPNGQLIASGSENKVQLWDITSGQLVHSFDVDGYVFSVAFHPDGQFIASGSEKNVQLWNIDSGQLAHSFDVGDSVVSVAFSPNGQFIAGSCRDKVLVWYSNSSQLVYSFDAGYFVTPIAFNPSVTLIASGSNNNKIQLWDLTSHNPKPVRSFNTDEHIASISFSPNGQFIASGSVNNKIQLWDLSSRHTSKPVRSFDVGDVGAATVFFVAFSPDGQFIVSGSNNDKIQLWNVPLPIYSFDVKSIVNSVAFSPDDHYIASGSWNSKIQLWDPSSRNPLPVHSFHVGKSVLSISFSPNGKLIASGSFNKHVQVWNIDSGQLVHSFDVGATVFSVAFSPNGTLIASGSNNNQVQVWSINSGQLVYSFNVGGDVGSVAFSPNGHYVASGSNNKKVMLWDITSGSSYPTYSFDVNEIVSSVAFSPNGQFIASGSNNNKIQIWSIDSGQLVHSFDVGDLVSSVAFSPDGQLIASGSINNKVQVWNIDSGRPVQSFDAGDTIFSIAFSSDGHYIASGSGNNKVQLWRITEV